MPSEEVRARTAKLHAAIEEYCATLDMQEGGMVGDWVVVGAWVYVDEEGDPDAQYFVALAGGSMLQHQVLGLVQKAPDVLRSGDDED
jgi:hypothetical protein